MRPRLFVGGLLALALVSVGSGALFVAAQEPESVTGAAGAIESPLLDPNSHPGALSGAYDMTYPYSAYGGIYVPGSRVSVNVFPTVPTIIRFTCVAKSGGAIQLRAIAQPGVWRTLTTRILNQTRMCSAAFWAQNQNVSGLAEYYYSFRRQ